MPDSQFSAALPLLIAFAQGLLIGLERGWHQRREKEGARIAGLRTYGLLGLLGGLIGLLAGSEPGLLIGLSLIAVTLFLLVGYLLEVLRDQDIGMTSLVAGVLTFMLGVAACRGYSTESAAAAVLVLFLLSYKVSIHAVLRALEPQELHATLKLLLISVVVLPVLPDRGIGPWQAINPYEVWWMVVLISAISFSGYFAMRIVGQRKGVLLTALLAGLASSTALTLSFSRLSRHAGADRESGQQCLLAAGILLACGTMFPRMLIVISLLNPLILPSLLLPLMSMALVVYSSAGLMFWHSLRSSGADGKRHTGLKNPLELSTALLFALLLMLLMLVTLWLKQQFGDAGVLLLSALSGITDVDAITLALLRMAPDEISLSLAVEGILLAACVNSLVKGGIACGVAGGRFGLRILLPMLLATAAALLGWWL